MRKTKLKTFELVFDLSKNPYPYIEDSMIDITGNYQTIVLNENEITDESDYGSEAVALVDELKVGESADVDDMVEGGCVMTRLS